MLGRSQNHRKRRTLELRHLSPLPRSHPIRLYHEPFPRPTTQIEAEAAAEQARRSLESATAPQESSSRRESRNRKGSLDSAAGSTGAVARHKASFDSAAGSASGGEEPTGGSASPPPFPRPHGVVAVGGWVREESVVGADGSSSNSRSSPLPPSRGASPAERGGRVVGRWVRRSGVGSRDSSLSVSPVLPPRKPPVGVGAAAAAEEGDARGSFGGIKQRGGDRVSLDSTAAAVEQDGGRGSTGSAAGLAVAAEEHDGAQARASFARDTGLAGPKDGAVRVSTSPVVVSSSQTSSQTKEQVLEARWEQESGSQGGTDRDSFEAGVFSPRVAAAGADRQSNAAAAEKEKAWRRSRSRSESVVDNEGLQVRRRDETSEL